LLQKLLIEGRYSLKFILIGMDNIEQLYDEIQQQNYILRSKWPLNLNKKTEQPDMNLVLVYTIKGWLQMFGEQYLLTLLTV
jgi:hypothetical protein